MASGVEQGDFQEEAALGFTLNLLGKFSLCDAAGRNIAVLGKKNRALLAILALSPSRTIGRERLAGLLWGDSSEEQARNSLRQSLAVLRKELGEKGSRLIVTRGDSLALQIEGVFVDALAVNASSELEDAGAMRAAAESCRGELLAELAVREPGLEDWLATERLRLAAATLRLFEKLAELETGQPRIAMSQRLVALDPLRETSQRLLMRAFADAGENALALRQYEKCRELIRNELGIEPAAETTELKQRIAAGAQVNRLAAGAQLSPADPLFVKTLAGLGHAAPERRPAIPASGSVAVLPFVNMSADPTEEFFTDGLTEDIITDLSKMPGLFVIARNSTLAYKGRPADVRQIAHDLGVKYILEGSARRSEKRLRINVQLSDAAAGGNYVWADRFDRELADVFAVQDEVALRVVEAIAGMLGASTPLPRYRPASLRAYDLCVRSRNQWFISKAANELARASLETAIEIEPDYCEAHWQLANTLIFDWLLWGGPQEPKRRDALALAERAVAIDPNDSTARSTLGYILLNCRRWDDAELQYDAAVRLNPNNADAFADIAYFHVMSGRPSEALLATTKAFRLNPRPPGWYYWIAGTAQVAGGECEKAVATLRREETYSSASRRMLAAALALSGRVAEAQAEATFFLATSPHWRIGSWVETQPFRNPRDADFWIDAFRLAGLPD